MSLHTCSVDLRFIVTSSDGSLTDPWTYHVLCTVTPACVACYDIKSCVIWPCVWLPFDSHLLLLLIVIFFLPLLHSINFFLVYTLANTSIFTHTQTQIYLFYIYFII